MGCLCSKSQNQPNTTLETGKVNDKGDDPHNLSNPDNRARTGLDVNTVGGDNKNEEYTNLEHETNLNDEQVIFKVEEKEEINVKLEKSTNNKSNIDKSNIDKSNVNKSNINQSNINQSNVNQSESGVEENSKLKKKKKAKVENGNFNDNMINTINAFRRNPKSYVTKVEELIPFITLNDKNKYILDKKGVPKIALNTGEAAFVNCANLLSNLKPLHELEFREHLAIELPTNPDDWSKAYSTLVNAKKEELADQYSKIGFHFDTSVQDPEVALLLQLVDDNSFKGMRRNNICSEVFKYIAVTHLKGEKKKFGSYYVFAE